MTKDTYNAKVAELDGVRAKDNSASGAEIKSLEAKIDDLNKQIADGNAKRDALLAEREQLKKQLDDSTALVGELKKRLEKLGQNVDKLSADNGSLAKTLADAKARLEELRQQKLAAEKRAQLFHGLVAKLRSMIDAGQLRVMIRKGQMIIVLPNDVLFDSGKTALKPAGQDAISKVAQALVTIKDRRFLIGGHTDNVPIHTAHFPSNWELSTARAVEVTTFLIAQGMPPEQLAAAGFGEFDPVVANDSIEHKAQNRRIEIIIEPNLSDLPSLDTLTDAASQPAGR